MSHENIDDLSMIEKVNQNNIKDDSTMSLYNTLIDITTPKKAPPTTQFIKSQDKDKDKGQAKPLCLLNNNKKESNNKQHQQQLMQAKCAISPSKTSPTTNQIINQCAITAKPIFEFLSNRECNHLSYSQSEYMTELDSLYSAKIKKMNEIDSKYDNELFSLREYLDGTNGNNINNIIYNSVLKDKMEEMKIMENEFNIHKGKALLLYYQRGNKMKELFDKEIYNTITDMKNDVIDQMKQLNK